MADQSGKQIAAEDSGNLPANRFETTDTKLMITNMADAVPIIGGIIATLAMTLFAKATFAVLRRPYNILRILGNMLLFEPYTIVRQPPPPTALTLATFVHYAIGVSFAFGYQQFVINNNDDRILETVVFGIVIALVAIVGWRLLFFLHPAPPGIDLKTYLFVIALGHLVLTACLYLFYAFI
jgi:hypothetical protein